MTLSDLIRNALDRKYSLVQAAADLGELMLKKDHPQPPPLRLLRHETGQYAVGNQFTWLGSLCPIPGRLIRLAGSVTITAAVTLDLSAHRQAPQFWSITPNS